MSTFLDKIRGAASAAPPPAVVPTALNAELLKPPIRRRMDRYVTLHPPSLDMIADANICAFRREPVLIVGESGTGKELVAKIMLANEPDSKFFPVNCAGIVDTLFESLIFGHVKGAYTGAITDKPGLFVSAGDGVVFMDEVGELPLSQQAKLLRVLQERVVTPVGSVAEVPVRARFVFATNRDLAAMVEAKTFREDLYYRISALELRTHPLRERPDDVGLIMEDICERERWDYFTESPPAHVVQSTGNVRALFKWMVKWHAFGRAD